MFKGKTLESVTHPCTAAVINLFSEWNWCVFCAAYWLMNCVCILCRIDSNVDTTHLNIEAAHTELVKYFQSVTSNRWLMIKIFGVLIIFFIIFVVFMAWILILLILLLLLLIYLPLQLLGECIKAVYWRHTIKPFFLLIVNKTSCTFVIEDLQSLSVKHEGMANIINGVGRYRNFCLGASFFQENFGVAL